MLRNIILTQLDLLLESLVVLLAYLLESGKLFMDPNVT